MSKIPWQFSDDNPNEAWLDMMLPTMKRDDPLRPKLPSKNQEMLYHLTNVAAVLELASISDPQGSYVGISFASDDEAQEFLRSVQFLQAYKKGRQHDQT